MLDLKSPQTTKQVKLGSRKYYRYIGSLIIPPYTKDVVWTIVRKVRTVTREQMKLIREAVHDLTSNVNANLPSGILYSSNAFRVWNDLQEIYDKVNLTRIYHFLRAICTLKQGVSPIFVYYSKIKDLWDEMDSILAFSSCNCDESKEYVGKLLQADECEVCQIKGHTKENCYKVIGYRVDFKGKKVVNVGEIMVQLPTGDSAGVSQIRNFSLTGGEVLKDDLFTGRVKEIGREVDVLYVLCLQNTTVQFENMKSMTAISSVPAELWHKRMGHVPMSVLRKFTTFQNSDKFCITHCEACPLARQTRVTFPISSSKADILENKSSYDIVYGKAPSLQHMRVIGCLWYATDVRKKDKFSLRAIKFVLLGYGANQKRYKQYDIDNKSIFVSRDVTFHEDIYPFQYLSPPINLLDSSLHHIPTLTPIEIFPSNPYDLLFNSGKQSHVLREPEMEVDRFIIDPIEQQVQHQDVLPRADSLSPTQDTHVQSSTFISQEQLVNKEPIQNANSYDYLSKTYQNFVAYVSSIIEPRSYQEAAKDSKWIEAMKAEIRALEENKTWEVVALPKG
ncbi:uncharacterized protein LOC142172693 [Nicotiana tabacum]|uniref:Uncharacterized protein LOC142172693 n=1 Tax=Nicotiana tabacum TaxID=4097 RepID=A0AC58T5G8_TOBAC